MEQPKLLSDMTVPPMPHRIPDNLVVCRLNEFVLQHKLPPLDWRIESRPFVAQEATQGGAQIPEIPKKKPCGVNVFDASCVIEGRTFDAVGLPSKTEAKRRVASLICQFYFDAQHPFFIKPVSFKAQYMRLLTTLSNDVKIPLPHFTITGAVKENVSPFKAECHIAGETFVSPDLYLKKSDAKDAVAKIAYEALLQNPVLKECMDKKMDYRIDPAKLNAQFKACFLGNAPVSGISRASSDTTGVAPVSVASFEQHSNVSTPVLVPQSYEHNSINPAHMSHYHLPTQAQHSAAAHIEPTSLQRPEVGYVSPSYQNFDTVPQNQSQYSQQQNPHLMSVESMSRQQGYPPPMQIEHMPNRQEYSNAMPVESIHSQQGYPQSVPMESVPYQQHQPGPQGYHPAPHQTNPYGAQYPMQTSYPDQSMYPMGHPPQPGLKSEPDLIVVLDRQTPSRHEEVPPSPQFSNKDFVSRSEGVRAGGRRAAGLETFDFDAPGTPPRSSGPPTLEYEDRTDAHRRSYDYSSEFPVTGPTSDLPRSRTRDRHGSGSDSHTGSSWMSDEENPRSYKSGRRAKGGSSRSYSRSPIRDKEREPRALRRCERSRSPNVRDSRRSLRDRSRSPRRRSKSPHERRRRRSQSPVSRDRRRSRSPVVRDRRRSPIFRERRRSRSPVVRERRRSPQRQTSANTANTETPAPQQRKKNGFVIPDNVGPFTRQLYEFAAEDPSLGKPVFYSRSSLVAPEEVIVQLTFGSKFFLSRSSHKKLISAQEDAAEVAVDEVTRMVSAKRKGQRRLSDVRLQIRPSAEALSGMVGARNDEGSLAGEPPTQALTRESPSIPSQVPSPVPMPANLSDQVPLPRAPAHIPPKVPIKGKRRAPKATTAMDSSEIRMLKREEEPAWEWLNEETWT